MNLSVLISRSIGFKVAAPYTAKRLHRQVNSAFCFDAEPETPLRLAFDPFTDFCRGVTRGIGDEAFLHRRITFRAGHVRVGHRRPLWPQSFHLRHAPLDRIGEHGLVPVFRPNVGAMSHRVIHHFAFAVTVSPDEREIFGFDAGPCKGTDTEF